VANVNDTLARNLRILRAARNITLYEVEEGSGLTRETVGQLEHGARGAHMSTLQKLADFYGVRIEDLLSGNPVLSPKAEAPQGGSGHTGEATPDTAAMRQQIEEELLQVNEAIDRLRDAISPEDEHLLRVLKGLSERTQRLARMAASDVQKRAAEGREAS
jgi:transcriptional regulator with XRE-family HTH domain